MNFIRRYWWRWKCQQNHSPYVHLFDKPTSSELVSLDCETTSLDPKRAELVTIAATKIRNNRIITSQSFHISLRAPQSLDYQSVTIHRLRHQDLTSGCSEQEAITQLIDFIGNRPLVGYHIRYDKEILDRCSKKHMGFPLPNALIEVSQIYHQKLERLLPNGYFDLSIEAISRHLDLPLPQRHDALEDAIAAALIYVRLTHGSFPNVNHINKKR